MEYNEKIESFAFRLARSPSSCIWSCQLSLVNNNGPEMPYIIPDKTLHIIIALQHDHLKSLSQLPALPTRPWASYSAVNISLHGHAVTNRAILLQWFRKPIIMWKLQPSNNLYDCELGFPLLLVDVHATVTWPFFKGSKDLKKCQGSLNGQIPLLDDCEKKTKVFATMKNREPLHCCWITIYLLLQWKKTKLWAAGSWRAWGLIHPWINCCICRVMQQIVFLNKGSRLATENNLVDCSKTWPHPKLLLHHLFGCSS